MRRTDPLNERQFGLLRRVADQQKFAPAAESKLRRSGYALRDRGLITMRRVAGAWTYAITDDGRYYLAHGHHPDRPAGSAARGPSRTESRRRAALTLIKKLADGPVRIVGPTASQRDELKKVVAFARRHDLVPDGHHLTRSSHFNAVVVELRDGPHPSASAPVETGPAAVPVPKQLRSPHPAIAQLRDDRAQLDMPAQMRRRALLLFQGLAAEAAGRGYTVAYEPNPRRRYPYDVPQRTGVLDLGVDGFTFKLKIGAESPNTSDPERAQRLRIEMDGMKVARSSWADRKLRSLDDVLAEILQELEHRAEAARRAQLEAERRQAAWEAHWRRTIDKAAEQAVQAHYAALLDDQVERWQHSKTVRAFCSVLSDRIAEAGDDLSPARIEAMTRWLDWAEKRADVLDPFLGDLTMPSRLEPKHADIERYLPNGMNPWVAGSAPYGWGRT